MEILILIIVVVIVIALSSANKEAKLKGYKVKHIAPGAHWLYKEKLLSDIYDETYPFEE